MTHLCNFEPIIETADGIKEVCNECKRLLVTHKGHKGAIDNRKYLKEHQRDFIQPNDPLFNKYYGEDADINFGKI